MLTVGNQFPDYNLTSVVSLDPDTAFTQITPESHEGKWRVVFFWPKDFTFVCPTEIAAFGQLNERVRRPRRAGPRRLRRLGVRAPGLARKPQGPA